MRVSNFDAAKTVGRTPFEYFPEASDIRTPSTSAHKLAARLLQNFLVREFPATAVLSLFRLEVAARSANPRYVP